MSPLSCHTDISKLCSKASASRAAQQISGGKTILIKIHARKILLTLFALLVISCVIGIVWPNPTFKTMPGTDTIAFESRHLQGYGAQIYIMNDDGSDPTRLTYNSQRLVSWLPFISPYFGDLISNTRPMYVPSENKIVFFCNLEKDGELYSIYPDGSNQNKINSRIKHHTNIQISPDGTMFAYIEHSQLFTANSDGSFQKCVICNKKTKIKSFSWSRDNKKLAVSIERDKETSIHIIDADGTGLLQITPWSQYIDLVTDWSPDGRKLVFSSTRIPNTSQIYSINIDGTKLRQLTDTKPPPGQVVGNSAPTWSPDSQRIAFVSNRDGQSEIYVMNADGSGQTRLTFTGRAGDPVWVPIH